MSKDALKLPDDKFMEAVSFMICGSKAINNAFVVVAYENYTPILQAAHKLAAMYPEKKVPTNIDEHILILEGSMNKASDEVAKRRFSWFYIATLVVRATQIADSNFIYRPQAIAVWESLVRSGACLRHILDTTVIWKEDEKIWFSDIKTEKDGELYVRSCLVPGWARAFITV